MPIYTYYTLLIIHVSVCCSYWYQFGCLYPDMGTVWIAVDKADRENGCVQVRYDCGLNSDEKVMDDM